MSAKLLVVDRENLPGPDSPLRRRSSPVLEFGSVLQTIINDMIAVLSEIPYGAGLSAVQIGIPIQLAVVTLNRSHQSPLIIANPANVTTSGRLTRRSEGCLCLPNYKALVARRNKLSLSARDRYGNIFEYDSAGYEAAVIQHELDHMEGRFYWDHLPDNEKPQLVNVV